MRVIDFIAQISVDPDDLGPPPPQDITSSDVATWLSFFFAIAGGVAFIMIIYAGIQFMLSQGDPSKSANARNSIIYASIGLALAAGAFAIVRFVVASL